MSQKLHGLPNLKAFRIADCTFENNLESFPEEGHLPKFELSECSLLMRKCKREEGDHIPNITCAFTNKFAVKIPDVSTAKQPVNVGSADIITIDLPGKKDDEFKERSEMLEAMAAKRLELRRTSFMKVTENIIRH